MNPVALAQRLLRMPSVTPDDGRALAVLEEVLAALGFDVQVQVFSDDDTPDVPNLYARIGTGSPNFCFAGHSDVVPTGPESTWHHAPFSGDVEDGVLHGRGAADMKGAIAAFISATARCLEGGPPEHGSISLLITGDEEGPGINGTKKMLAWLEERGERIDLCLVGEPTNPTKLGEQVKIGRRGSLHGYLTVRGTAGHVAYPHLAHNPLPTLAALIAALSGPLDEGNAHFQPSNLEVLDVQVGNETDNLIPAEAKLRFNVRFTADHTPAEWMEILRKKCAQVTEDFVLDFRLSGDAFLTEPGFLSETVANAVANVLGARPALTTTGGTSDARFIKDHCPVVEFGLVGATMHKLDEQALVADIEQLTDIYAQIIERVLCAKET